MLKPRANYSKSPSNNADLEEAMMYSNDELANSNNNNGELLGQLKE